MTTPSTSSGATDGAGVVVMAVSDVRPHAPWCRPLDRAHIRRLVNVLDGVPPITVAADGRLIDGHHRLQAHELDGRTTIRAHVLPADLDERALVRIVIETNAHHGLPLSSTDRRRLAIELLTAGWDGSNAELARLCRVRPGSVPSLRALAAEQHAKARTELGGLQQGVQPVPGKGLDARRERRTGRNGRTYPTDPAAQRRRILAAAQERPGASNAEIARQVGCSPTTVANTLTRWSAAPPTRRVRLGFWIAWIADLARRVLAHVVRMRA